MPVAVTVPAITVDDLIYRRPYRAEPVVSSGRERTESPEQSPERLDEAVPARAAAYGIVPDREPATDQTAADDTISAARVSDLPRVSGRRASSLRGPYATSKVKAKRQAKHIDRVRANGGKIINTALDRESTDALARLTAALGSEAKSVRRALVFAALNLDRVVG